MLPRLNLTEGNLPSFLSTRSLSSFFSGGSSESMVASVTAEIKLQVDKIEVLSPTVVPMQNEIAALTASSNSLQAQIASMKAQVSSNNTDKNAKEDTISNTSNDIMILKDTIAQKKAEIDPLPGQIDVSCFS